MNKSIHTICCMLILLMVERLHRRIPSCILILPRPSHHRNLRLRRRRPVNPKEAYTILNHVLMPAAVEQRRQSHRLAGPIQRAGQVETLRSTHHRRPELVALRQLVVDHSDGAEHELLKGHSRRELAGGDEGLVAVFAVEDAVVGAVLEEQVVALGGAVQAGEVREVVVVVDDVFEVVVVE